MATALPDQRGASTPSSPLASPYGPPEEVQSVRDLKNFLANAPRLWRDANDPPVRKYKMANGEEISCVFWKGNFFITGTDVVKVLIFRFQQFGRGILNPKKFEEGVFSDLRNLKPGQDAVLEEPRSEFLEFLHKHGCIRTQKKQKVFFWHRVPHEDLLREALERNLKRVTNVFNWTQMMGTPEMLNQYMMMQAAGQLPLMSNPHPHHSMMMSNAVRMMPQTTPYLPFGGAVNASRTASMMPPVSMGSVQQLCSPLERSAAPPSNEYRTHPRRTISLSAVDFAPRPAEIVNPMMPAANTMAGAAFPTSLEMTDISSALSSPLFTPGPEIELDDGYFDINDAELQEETASLKPVLRKDDPSMSVPLSAPNQQAVHGVTGDPAINANDKATKMDDYSGLQDELGRMADSPAALLETNVVAAVAAPENISNSSLDHQVLQELDALGGSTPPSEMIMNSAGLDLMNDLWPNEKSMNTPLWDDLSMMMPNMAPNLRDLE